MVHCPSKLFTCISLLPGQSNEMRLSGASTRRESETRGHVQVKCGFFNKYNESQRLGLVRIARHVKLEHHEAVFKQDDYPDGVYLVLSGRCAIYKSQGEMRKLVTHLQTYDTVGGIFHLDERQRRAVTAEVSAPAGADFIFLEKEALDVLTGEWKAQAEHEKASFLSSEIPVFNSVPRSVLAQLSHYFEEIRVPEDTVVYRQQDEAVCMFFVKSGEVEMVRRFDLIQQPANNAANNNPLAGGTVKLGNNGQATVSPERVGEAPRKCSKSVQIAVMRKGEFFGEVEVFNDIPRTSAVIASRPCTLLALQKQTLSGDVLPQNLVENVFRYGSMRASCRNSRISLILQSLGVLQASACQKFSRRKSLSLRLSHSDEDCI